MINFHINLSNLQHVLFQFEDTAAFLIIMTVIMMCYNVSFYALLYPNSEFSWQQLEKITRNGYWMLFGELNLDADTRKTISVSAWLNAILNDKSLHL